jgi:hypothetical protein
LFPQIQAASISQQPLEITGDIEGKPVSFLAKVKRIELADGDVELLVQVVPDSGASFQEAHLERQGTLVVH